MKRILTIVLAMVFLSASTSSGFAQDQQAGLAFAKKHCGNCHAFGMTDKSLLSKATALRDFTSSDLAKFLAQRTSVGHPFIPKSVRKSREVDNFLGYIDWLRSQENEPQ